MKHIVGARVLYQGPKGILLVRRRSFKGGCKKHFKLPGGEALVIASKSSSGKVVFRPENPKETAQRIFLKQTGLHTKRLVPFAVHRTTKGKGQHRYTTFFRATRVKGRLRLGKDMSAFAHYDLHNPDSKINVGQSTRKAFAGLRASSK